jgi:hypothetical protein
VGSGFRLNPLSPILQRPCCIFDCLFVRINCSCGKFICYNAALIIFFKERSPDRAGNATWVHVDNVLNSPKHC